jgi:serine/threonine protein kinase
MKTVAERLLREARALARIRHPGIVEVYDCGLLEDGAPYLVMEKLSGESLADALARGPLAAAAAARLFVTVLDALAAAHRAGVVHRDLKPDNIFLVAEADGSRGRTVKVVDFGIAVVAADRSARDTSAGGMVGTPAYMSPEQFRGERGDARADIWGATAALYEAVVGAPPFGDDSVVGVMARILEAPLPFPRAVRLDSKLWAILARGLRKDPAQRFASAEELRDALGSWLATRSGEPTATEDRAPTVVETIPAFQPVDGPAATPTTKPPSFDDVVRNKLTGD